MRADQYFSAILEICHHNDLNDTILEFLLILRLIQRPLSAFSGFSLGGIKRAGHVLSIPGIYANIHFDVDTP